MNKALIIILVAIGLNSCIKVDLNPETADLAVWSTISPGDAMVKVFLSKYLKNGESVSVDKSIPDAKVQIISDNDTLNLYQNQQSKVYEAENAGFILPTKTYTLRVETQNGKITTAETTVPPSYLLKLDTLYQNGEVYSLKVSWGKDKTPSNFQLMAGLSFNINQFGTGIKWDNNSGILNLKHQDDIWESTGFFEFLPNATEAMINVILDAYNDETFDLLTKYEAIDQKTELFELLEPPIIPESNISGNTPGFFGSYTRSELNFTIKK